MIRTDFVARGAQHALAAGELDHLRDPVAGRVRRVGPLQHRDPRARSSGHLGGHRVEPRAQGVDQRRGRRRSRPVTLPRSSTESSTSSRVCGSTVSTSARQPRWASAASTVVTSTAQTAQRSWVTTRSASRSRRASADKPVEVLAAGDRVHDVRVDLGRRQALRHRGRRDDRAGPGLGGRVALERHADDVVTRADREEDLRRRREQRHDPHVVNLRSCQVDDPTTTVLALLALAAVAAGFVDAVVGGGGLIQLPALLLGLPNASPVQILATNKLGVDLRDVGQLGDVLPPGAAGPAHLRAADGAGLLRRRPGRAGRLADPARGVRADRAGGADRGRRLRPAQARPRLGDGPAARRAPAPRRPRWRSAS